MGIVFVSLFAATAIGLLLAGRYFSADARIARALKGVQRTPISQVKDGAAVKIVGKLVRLSESFTAPLSGRRCAYYLVVVEEYRSSGRSGSWVEVIREERRHDFVLQDETGARAMVRMREAKVAVVKDANFTSGTLNDPTPVLAEFMLRHGHDTKGLLFNKSLRYREGVLEPGEDIAVGGIARWEPDPDPDPGAPSGAYREVPQRLLMQGTEPIPLFISDDLTATR